MNKYLILVSLVLLSGVAFAYVPPVYIANPDNGHCQYYFAGDSVHYNEPPSGNWYIVGISDINETDCQDRCFFNTNKFWSEVLQVTRSGMNLSSVPLEYRMFTDIGCLCYGNGSQGCTNWCRLNNGSMNQTNVSISASCICPSGTWIPGKGCKEAITNQSDNSMILQAALAFIIGIFVGLALYIAFQVRKSQKPQEIQSTKRKTKATAKKRK